MTQVIEIIVIGAVGSGKSHVLDVIARALRGTYGVHAQITSHELSLEKNLGHYPTKPRVAETIFNLREQSDANYLEVIARRTLPKIDHLEISTAVQGEALSFALDPLEQAIELTTRVLRDEREHLAQINAPLCSDVPPSPIYKRMSNHLESLLAVQLKRVGIKVTGDE